MPSELKPETVFEAKVRRVLERGVADEMVIPTDVDALIWRIRGAVRGEAAWQVEQIDFEIALAVQKIRPEQIAAFQNRLAETIATLTERFDLTIDYPETLAVREALHAFKNLISGCKFFTRAIKS